MDETQVINKFLVTLKKCLQELRKQQAETRGTDEDIAHFFDPSLKTWVRKNQYQIITLLGGMNFERPFVTFVKNYLLKDEKKPYQRSIQSQVNEAGEKAASESFDKAFLKSIDEVLTEPSDIVRQKAANYKADVINADIDNKFIRDIDNRCINTMQQIGQPTKQKRRGLL